MPRFVLNFLLLATPDDADLQRFAVVRHSIALFSSPEAFCSGIIDNFYYGLLFSLPIFAPIALKRTADLRAGFLFAVALPGALGALAVLVTLAVNSPKRAADLLLLVLLFPAFWMLPPVAIMQAFQLHGPKRPVTIGSGVWIAIATMLMIGLYYITAYANRDHY